MQTQTTFRRFGVEVYIEKKKRIGYEDGLTTTTTDGDDSTTATLDGGSSDPQSSVEQEPGTVIVNTKGFRLSVNPFFFKNRVDFQQLTSPKVISAANTTNTATSSTPQTFILTEDAGIPKPLNDTIFDIFSRAQHLSSLQHENLCQFITAQPSQKHHDQMLVVSEDYQNSLKSVIDNCINFTYLHSFQIEREKKYIESNQLGLYCYQILKALSYLHSNRITHRNLSIENIKLNQENHVKLVNYGLYHLSKEGENVSFPIGNLLNLSPESILQADIIKGSSNPKCDVWALGCVMLEASLKSCLWNDRDPSQSLNRILYISNLPSNQQFNFTTLNFESSSSSSSSISSSYKLLPQIEKELQQMENNNNNDSSSSNNNDTNRLFNIFGILEELEKNQDNGFGRLDQGLRDVIKYCLNPSLLFRPFSKDLLDHPYFNSFKSNDPFKLEWVEKPCVKSSLLPDDLFSTLESEQSLEKRQEEFVIEREHYDIYSPLEIFYLWKLSGGDLDKELVTQGLATPSPSVHKLPLFVPLLNTTISGDNVQEMMRLDKESNGLVATNQRAGVNGIIHSRTTSVLAICAFAQCTA
ncbi:RabGAP/TBC domain-containing protein [Cavenderia fasciculata]|uniref:non-specific serine/threonine protein kinase n=1 Tax=Cavenderia fasciculata TaxID=261658 RepID=F4PNB2_CACFS|nr:RabGAP/TBC domain-containing protein [Cavenderia fasciculata]EGG22965.1 RabGAP/TBC domain-containing protein [Cavenderia fasciculata]|eukprot:XP_004360816.1 RabGAP/TBC domain-containing protein [Cavenderia fasciculata]